MKMTFVGYQVRYGNRAWWSTKIFTSAVAARHGQGKKKREVRALYTPNYKEDDEQATKAEEDPTSTSQARA